VLELGTWRVPLPVSACRFAAAPHRFAAAPPRNAYNKVQTPAARSWGCGDGMVILFAASLFEVDGVRPQVERGFTDPRPVVAILAAASMWLLALALRSLPVGTGYAVWTGLGAVLTALAGIIALGESREPMRLAGIAAVVAGVVLLQLSEPH
jgi:quaternary ammonium compound-resistance protein SugE